MLDSELRRNLATTGQTRVRERFTLARLAEETARIFEREHQRAGQFKSAEPTACECGS
jgi:hypothetical protein